MTPLTCSRDTSKCQANQPEYLRNVEKTLGPPTTVALQTGSWGRGAKLWTATSYGAHMGYHGICLAAVTTNLYNQVWWCFNCLSTPNTLANSSHRSRDVRMEPMKIWLKHAETTKHQMDWTMESHLCSNPLYTKLEFNSVHEVLRALKPKPA